MNREILFRGKTNQNRWVYGSPLIGKDTTPIMNFWKGEGLDKRLEWVYADEKTIGQYTGLKDKNGKKIFEGDMLSVLGRKPKEVVYGNKHGCCAYFLKDTDYILNQSFVDNENIVIIGNIHDNPELLGQ